MSALPDIDPLLYSGAMIHVQLGEGGHTVLGFLRVREDTDSPSQEGGLLMSIEAVVPSQDLGRSLPGEVCFFLSSQDMRCLKLRELVPKPDHKTPRIYEYLLTIDPHRLSPGEN